MPDDIAASEKKRAGVNEVEFMFALPVDEDGSAAPDTEALLFAFLPVRSYGFRWVGARSLTSSPHWHAGLSMHKSSSHSTRCACGYTDPVALYPASGLCYPMLATTLVPTVLQVPYTS